MQGRTTLIVGCSDPVMSEVYRFFDETAHLPIQGYHLLPTDRKMSTSMSVDYWSAMADRSPLPLWLYSKPGACIGTDGGGRHRAVAASEHRRA